MGDERNNPDRAGGIGLEEHPPDSQLILVDRQAAQIWRVHQDERLEHLFEEQCDWIQEYGRGERLAIDSGDLTLTYGQLDANANRLARYLRLQGTGVGDRVALLLDSPALSYVAMLAILKIGGTYVALDTGYPAGRLAYIIEDAQVATVLSTAAVIDRLEHTDLLTADGATLVRLDAAAGLIEEMDGRRLLDAERGIVTGNPTAYISYASASGRPEGVAIDHAGICNFVKVAAETYGIRSNDRVYQGLPLALDFSVEEIWVPWACGATLVPKPTGPSLLGAELHTFLRDQGVSALCCVPRTLETMEGDLPQLRFLLMCGKDADPDLIERWHRPGRRFLNVYGPTEATVTATWAVLRPDKPVTIGTPLPTYATVILDPDHPGRALPHGRLGEIGIAGLGLACGYLNHDDLTDDRFIVDFLDIPANPSGRIYRTGDLGRVNEDLELEYHGPVDPNAERGYRVELADIRSLLVTPPIEPSPVVDPSAETVLVREASERRQALSTGAELPPPLRAVAETMSSIMAELAGADRVTMDAHFFDDLGADSLVMAQFCARVRTQPDLPAVSMKDIYRFPTVGALTVALADARSTPMERSLAEVMSGLIGTASVGVESNFFDDLGADSLVMAQFCARVRKRVDLPAVSMKDVYRAPTIRSLTVLLGGGDPDADGATSAMPAIGGQLGPDGCLPPIDTWEPSEVYRPTTARYLLCGAAQLASLITAAFVMSVIAIRGLEWTIAGPEFWSMYRRSLVFSLVTFLGLCALPVALKWLLVGRWTPQQFPVWGLAYLRFWLAKVIVRTSPLALLVGSPLYSFYLRSLGARIGKRVVIFSSAPLGAPDLLSIGDHTVIRKDAVLQCYRAHRGMIQIGPVTLGENVVVGAKSVIEINAVIGDDGQLGHGSALHFGQRIPPGQSWHGSPAEPTTTDYRLVEPARCGGFRRVTYTGLLLVFGFVLAPALASGVITLVRLIPQVPALFAAGPGLGDPGFYIQVLIASAALYFGGTFLALILVSTVPRLLNTVIKPDRVYPLYGFHFLVQQTIAGATNIKAFTELFGDSRYITGYLQGIGYRLRPVEQTGSNFGGLVSHDNPFRSQVGTGTVVADGLAMVNADYSSTSFKVSTVSVGRSSFLGNNIVYPSQARVGDDCLLATKVLVPIDGPVRHGVGLLGSPSFEIPRTVDRDKAIDVLSPDDFRQQMRGKTVHNTVTILLRLVSRWLVLLTMLLLVAAAAVVYRNWGTLSFAVATTAMPWASLAIFVLVDRAMRHLQTLVPSGCSIYDQRFWRHERFWKVPFTTYQAAFDGTPFKPLLWRLIGVRIGRRVFDDGCTVIEKAFVSIGDYTTLNAGCILQSHSQEDGAFKSDHCVIGAGCTLGVGAFVHYGVTVGDEAVLAPDSFLMKGEQVPPAALWGGNPATEVDPERRIREHHASEQLSASVAA